MVSDKLFNILLSLSEAESGSAPFVWIQVSAQSCFVCFKVKDNLFLSTSSDSRFSYFFKRGNIG